MKDFLEYVKLAYQENSEEFENIISQIEMLYFAYIIKPFKFLRRSEVFKISSDLLKIQQHLSINRRDIKGLKLKSKLIAQHDLVQDNIRSDNLSDEDIDLIKNDLIKKYRYFITTAFIADIINKEYHKNQLKWVLTFLLGLFTAVLSFFIAFLKHY